MIPYHLPLQEKATRAHPPELKGCMIKVQKSIHRSETTFTLSYVAQNDLLFQSLKRQKLPLQMTFRRPGDEYEKTKAKAQTLISPHHAGVLVDDEAQTRICLHPERESRVEEIQISLLPGGGHRGDVDQTQTCLHHGGHALLTDRQWVQGSCLRILYISGPLGGPSKHKTGCRMV